MNRRGIINVSLLLMVTLTALLFPVTPTHVSAASPQVLLLYDSLSKGTAKEGNVNELERLLAAYSVKVTLKSLDQYEQGMLAKYTNVMMVVNADDIPITNSIYLDDLRQYQGQYLHIGYSPPETLKEELQLGTDVMYNGNAELRIGQFEGIQLKVHDMPYIVASKGARSYGQLSFRDNNLQVPYAVSKGKALYVPYFKKDNANVLAMGYVLKDWLHITAIPKMYLVLKEIYPFSDLDLLGETAEKLYQAGIPFLASVRPVFSNTDYPAMHRYLDALKKVQGSNGSILVNAPAVMPTINSSDHTLKGKMNDFINLLVQNGIGPLGVGAEVHWTYDKEYSEAGMGFFDSAVLFPDEQMEYMERSDTSKSFSSSLYSAPLGLLQEMYTPNKVMPSFPMDTVITVDMPKNKQELEKLLSNLERYWISFADYK